MVNSRRRNKNRFASFNSSGSSSSGSDTDSDFYRYIAVESPLRHDGTTDLCTEFYDTEDDMKRNEASIKSITDSINTASSIISSKKLNELDIENILCDSLANCASMQHIIENLKIYQLIETNQIDDIDLLQRLDENIVDHYHHIIIEHIA